MAPCARSPMDPRRRDAVLLVAFAGLLAFHLWLLQRTVSSGNAALSALLAVAVAVFAWRIVHHGNRLRGAVPAVPETRETELRRIRIYAPILGGLLVLHAWLISQLWAAGDVVFVALLAAAVTVFAVRLAMYARRWRELRHRPTGEHPRPDAGP